MSESDNTYATRWVGSDFKTELTDSGYVKRQCNGDPDGHCGKIIYQHRSNLTNWVMCDTCKQNAENDPLLDVDEYVNGDVEYACPECEYQPAGIERVTDTHFICYTCLGVYPDYRCLLWPG